MTEKQKVQLRRKWKRWIKKIGNDLGNLLTGSDVFKDLRRIVESNRKIQSPATLHTWISRNFADSVAMGIRRLNDHDKRSISLYRLIEDILEHPDAITRKFYASTYPKYMRDEGFADRDFDQFANRKDNLISPYKLKRDMRKLDNDTEIIRKFANKWVAHSDLKQRRYTIPTFTDVNNILEKLDRLYCKYHMLLTRGGLTTRKPVLAFDWREPLRYVWLPKNQVKE